MAGRADFERTCWCALPTVVRHAGFGNEGYLYCSRGPHVVTFSSFSATYAQVAGREAHPWTLSEQERGRVESALLPCPCGGYFRFSNPLVCPRCHQVRRRGLPEDIHYEILDLCVSDEAGDPTWAPARPAGP